MKAMLLLRQPGMGPGAKTVSDYPMLQLAGEGTYGVAFKSTHHEHGGVVVKRSKDSDWGRFVKEIDILSRLRHENIINILDVEARPRMCIVMEDGGLALSGMIRKTLLRPMPGWTVYLEQVVKGMVHAHAKGVIHTDLKPGNLVVSPGGLLKVIDWDCALIDVPTCRCVHDASTSELLYGTLWYRAPEVILGDPTFWQAHGCLGNWVHRPRDGALQDHHVYPPS